MERVKLFLVQIILCYFHCALVKRELYCLYGEYASHSRTGIVKRFVSKSSCEESRSKAVYIIMGTCRFSLPDINIKYVRNA